MHAPQCAIINLKSPGFLTLMLHTSAEEKRVRVRQVYKLASITRKATSLYLNISRLADMNYISCILSEMELRTQPNVTLSVPLA